MKTALLTLILALGCTPLAAQIHLKGYKQADIASQWLVDKWSAQWISVPDEPANVYGVYHFRKSFDLKSVPDRFIVHVTADNRYKLYVNGELVSLGPSRGDIYNWNFETVDLAPYLKPGKNVLASVVWNYADQKPVAQVSFNQTGFLLQGNTDVESIANTDDSWLCLKNKAYSPWNKRVLGYYVAGPGEQMDAELYPWGWEQLEYADGQWQKALAGMNGGIKGARDYPGRLLVPSPIPPMEMKPERLESVRIEEGIQTPRDFLKKKTTLTIPANSQVRLLLDNGVLTTGYFSLLFSKGKDASVTIGYAESLYEIEEGKRGFKKGNRNEITGKRFIGYEDKVIADGGENRNFTTLWWRTWRYIDLHIQTSSEPLVLEDIQGIFSAYPFQMESAFSAPGHEDLNKMLEIGWRTARLCAHETYMDCPYYEQLQYLGDTRIQAMISLYNTQDPYMVKNAIEQGRQSMVADGITMSRYPSELHQFIPSFSLWWICMGHDYWMYRGDEAYMKTLLPAYRNILSWYEQWLKPDKSLSYIPHWYFADWASGFMYGEPIREKEGNSAFQDLLYLIALEANEEMERAFGIPAMADYYKQMASDIRATIIPKYWDETRGLFADTQDHRSFSQHVNTLAILSKIVTGKKAEEVMVRTLKDNSLIQATIYFRYYVHQALKIAGLGDQLLENLQIWRDQMALGLTTWAEQPEPSRSDCHAWSASPNVEFFRTLLGIESQAPGFKEVRIAPALGELKEVSGKIPHPKGFVSVSYQIKKNELIANIELPVHIQGTFIWNGKEYPLTSGKQMIRVALNE